MDIPGLDLPDYLTRHPDGTVVLTGFRIRLFDIARDFWDGKSPEQMQLDYELPSLAQLYKTVGFYLDNQAAVDDMVRRTEAELEHQRATGHHLDVATLRARMAALERQHRVGA
jgi:uncharacterized protein (DUF433 family)